MASEHTAVKARSARLTIKDLGDEVVIYDLDTDQAHLLNPTLTFVWRQCREGTTVGELRRLVGAFLGIDEGVDDVVDTAIRDLRSAGLLDAHVAASVDDFTISRRSLLKKAGIAAVALPAITTILAPPAAATHSSVPCLGANQSCTISSDPHTVPCCSSYTCTNTTTGTQCCNKALGAVCAGGDACCEGSCTGGVCCRAAGANGSCSNHDQCCGTAVCSNSACIACVANGTVPPNNDETLCCTGTKDTVAKQNRCCTTATGPNVPAAVCTSNNDCCGANTCFNPGGGAPKYCRA